MLRQVQTAILNALSTFKTPSGWLVDAFRGGVSVSGVTVTDDKALQINAVYACIDRLSSGVASLPLITYQRLPNGGRERASNFYLYEILHNRPNLWQSPYEFWRWMMINVLLRGNAYAYIDRDSSGRVRNLIPIHPDDITVLVPESGVFDSIAYRYKHDTEQAVTFLQNEILHIRGMETGNPLIGSSVIQVQREVLGMVIATENQSGAMYANGTRLSGILKTPHKIDKEQIELISEEWRKIHGGSSNAHKVAVLGADFDFRPISMTAEAAQLVESRELNAEMIAGMYNVPPHMIGHNKHSTFSNIEHQDLAFVKHSLRPWMVNIEQAIYRSLLTTREKEIYYVEFLADALLRTDTKTRAETNEIHIRSGVLSPNEVRELMNRNPYQGGDAYYFPLNHQEINPDAPDDDSIDNTQAKIKLIRQDAERLIKRSIGDAKKAARKQDKNEIILSATESDALFIKIMGCTVEALAPGADPLVLAKNYQSTLVAALSVDGDLNQSLSNWQKDTIAELENIAHA